MEVSKGCRLSPYFFVSITWSLTDVIRLEYAKLTNISDTYGIRWLKSHTRTRTKVWLLMGKIIVAGGGVFVGGVDYGCWGIANLF